MERWEYQVIHLNVEAPTPAQPPAPPAPPAAPPAQEPAAGAAPIRVEAVFSKEYLEKEFPGFYGAHPAAGAPAKEHPANQLRAFLNLQGHEGWQLLGFYPVGQLTMMIFRRPLPPEPAAAEPAAAESAAVVPAVAEPVAAEPEATSELLQAADPGPAAALVAAQPPASGDEGVLRADQAPVLDRILARLEALERRLPQPSADAVAEASGQPDGQSGPLDGEILSPERLGELDGLPRLPTSQAALALGFRSAASLLNLAARSGYRQGLVKRGANDALAVYMGSEKSGRGGRDRRLWVVLPGSCG
jgi:hypothetical protein